MHTRNADGRGKATLATRKQLNDLRKEIDSIDEKIVGLVSERARHAQKIGQAKRATSKDVLDPGRERTVMERVRAANEGPLADPAVEAIFREIVSACRASQQPVSAAFLGPAGTFSHVAATRQFGSTADYHAVDTIADVFKAAETGRVRYGVVPIENTIEGAVTPTLDGLSDTPLQVVAELTVPVDHFLLSKSGDRSKIKRIISHPQPIGQCRRYLARRFPGIELVESASTAAAAQAAKRSANVAAIASKLAANLYGLKVAARSIQDEPGNVTRFLVVGPPQPTKRTGKDRTSLVIAVRDRVGVLGRILGPFTSNKVNLSMIESRPLRGRPWEYRFFVDITGHVDDRRVARALEEVDQIALSKKVLGSYPIAE